METPELDKISKVRDKSQAIGEFLDWLTSEKNYQIAEWIKVDEFEEKQLYTIHLDINKLLEEFFEIDGKKAEEERQAILDDIRSKNKSE